MSESGPSGHKRKPSAHQNQMRFFTILFISLGAVIMGVVFYLLNRPR
jgi:hypothetical protein